MRCTASMHEMLSDAGVLQEKTRWGYIFDAFYPKILRIKLVRFAQANDLKVIYKEGVECRDWE
jgi:hypothetical protein